MSVLKWTAPHRSQPATVRELVTLFKFEPTDEGFLVRKIEAGTHWREVKIKVKSKEVIFYVHKEEESTTEIYFEYLFESGFIFGQIANALQNLPQRGVDEDDDEDDDEEDSMELEGD